MEIKKLRQVIGMSQRQFSAHYGIPLGTLRNWEQGISNPPNYVFTMILATSRRDQMINVETIKFIRMLDKLADLTKNGFAPFADAAEDNHFEKVFNDESKPDENGAFPIALDVCINEEHHDIISYYDSDSNEYTARVYLEDGEDPSIEVRLLLSDEVVVIHDGKWYFG